MLQAREQGERMKQGIAGKSCCRSMMVHAPQSFQLVCRRRIAALPCRSVLAALLGHAAGDGHHRRPLRILGDLHSSSRHKRMVFLSCCEQKTKRAACAEHVRSTHSTHSMASQAQRPTCSSCCAMAFEKRIGSMTTPASLSTAGRVRLRNDTSVGAGPRTATR